MGGGGGYSGGERGEGGGYGGPSRYFFNDTGPVAERTNRYIGEISTRSHHEVRRFRIRLNTKLALFNVGCTGEGGGGG